MPKVTITEPVQSSQSEHNSKALADPKGFFVQPSSSTEEVAHDASAHNSLELQGDIVLFIKMALHPLTLEDFIWGEGKSRLRYCFHTQICVRILLGILDGLEYIHDEGIIHRDIKPSNIFLSTRKGPKSNSDRVIDITGCYKCGISSGSRTFITPHIGDFGLAAEVKSDQLVPHSEGNVQVSSSQP
jgi:serine/threonine protein kinase